MVVFGQLGRGKSRSLVPLDGKSALARWLCFDALRSGRPVVVLDARDAFEALDDLAGCERVDLAGSDDRVIDPLRGPALSSSSSSDAAGEW
jgi:hypothetical protein